MYSTLSSDSLEDNIKDSLSSLAVIYSTLSSDSLGDKKGDNIKGSLSFWFVL